MGKLNEEDKRFISYLYHEKYYSIGKIAAMMNYCRDTINRYKNYKRKNSNE